MKTKASISLKSRDEKAKRFEAGIGVPDNCRELVISTATFYKWPACYMVLKRDLLQQFNFSDSQKTDLLKYIENNLSAMYTVSLRVAFKLAMLIQDDPHDWRSLADDGLIKN